MASIGYANKPGKAERVAAAGADAIVTDMTDLARALAATRRPASQLPWIESAGGPLVLVPTAAVAAWRGASCISRLRPRRPPRAHSNHAHLIREPIDGLVGEVLGAVTVTESAFRT